jgi:hypothetical protein
MTKILLSVCRNLMIDIIYAINSFIHMYIYWRQLYVLIYVSFDVIIYTE